MVCFRRSCVAMASAVLCACPKSDLPAEPKDVPGVYTCNMPGSRQEIVFKADGTFIQTIDRQPPERSVGRWSAGGDAPHLQVLLSPYQSSDDGLRCVRAITER